MRTCASVSRTDCRSRCVGRSGRRPPMTSPTRPRSISVSFARTQRCPGGAPAPNHAFAALQREPTTGRMSTHTSHAATPCPAWWPRATGRGRPRGGRPRAGGAGDPGARRRRCCPPSPPASSAPGGRADGPAAPLATVLAPGPRPARACRGRRDQAFCTGRGRPRRGSDRRADPHQRVLLLVPRRTRAPQWPCA